VLPTGDIHSVYGGVFKWPLKGSAYDFKAISGFVLAPRATIDFETKSELDIKDKGAWLYSRHSSTKVLTLTFKLPGYLEGTQWVIGEDIDKLSPLVDWIRKKGLVEAHNSFFERCIWANCFRLEFPELPRIALRQWRCSAAKARAWGLPGSLEEANKAIGAVEVKDSGGKKDMLFFCRPRPRRKGKPIQFNSAEDHPERWKRFLAYNRQDVIAEESLSSLVPDLSPFEQRIWEADQRANWKGVKIDVELCKAALLIEEDIKANWAKQLFRLTGIESYSKRAQILEWLNSHGVAVPNTQAETLDHFLSLPSIKGARRRVLMIAREGNKVSNSKYARMLSMCDTDGRVRDLILYYGAATGRWSGKGIQVQNYPKGSLDSKGEYPWNLSMDEATALVKSLDVEAIKARFGNRVLDFLSSCLRGALIPSKGKRFIVADYSAVEARVVLWLAGDEEALKIFREGKDLYCWMASLIYGREITKKDKKERQFGKTVILALGYGMGFVTFTVRVRKDGLRFTKEEAISIVGSKYQKYKDWVDKWIYPTPKMFDDNEDGKYQFRHMAAAATKNRVKLEKECRVSAKDVYHELVLCKYVVDMYRRLFSKVKDLWELYEVGAKEAIRCKHTKVDCGNTSFYYDGKVLLHLLPTGRPVVYQSPIIKSKKTPWGGKSEAIFFKGVDAKTRKYGWRSTYGAMLVERASQGSARDAMAIAMVRADEDARYDPILTVHDELLCEVDSAAANVKLFECLMADVGKAFSGCPIVAEGAVFDSYRKAA
jgi:DNA polymerase